MNIGCREKKINKKIFQSKGCTIKSSKISGAETYFVNIANADRKYILSIPLNYESNKAYKLIFIWHSLNQRIENLYPSKLETMSKGDTIFVYPQGLKYLTIGLGWYTNNNSIDFKFYDYLYEHLLNNYCIDKSKVFSYGHSFGALMTNSLACFRGNQFKAVSSISSINYFEDKICKQNTNMLMAHGIYDNHIVVSYQNGLKALEFWGKNKNCSPNYFNDSNGCKVFKNCKNDLIWCPYPGGHDKWVKADIITWEYFNKFFQ